MRFPFLPFFVALLLCAGASMGVLTARAVAAPVAPAAVASVEAAPAAERSPETDSTIRFAAQGEELTKQGAEVAVMLSNVPVVGVWAGLAAVILGGLSQVFHFIRTARRDKTAK